MIRIGITGQAGFVGSHLFNFLGLQKDIIRIPFKDEYFRSKQELQRFAGDCDVIVHLAALNRHTDPRYIYDTNIMLVEQLIEAMQAEKLTPHIIFSSSIQETYENPYGDSKKIGREKFSRWAESNNAIFSGLIIPNVYGPFGKPFYNSVIATFCHQLTHGLVPEIVVDSEVKLIYVHELVSIIWETILKRTNQPDIQLNHTTQLKVSAILETLNTFKSLYLDLGIIPELDDSFKLNLFNTFRSFIEHQTHFPFRLKLNTDERGSFVESIKSNIGGQFSFSTTKPGITRGNHFHTRKIERFIVIQGNALIELRRIGSNEVLNFELRGDEPAFVDMPVWYTHNITNTGSSELLTLFWINEFYNPEKPDTYFESV